MKIGLLGSDYSPQVGGGYTFESEVLGGLLRRACANPHQWALLSAQATPPGSLPASVEYLHLAPSLPGSWRHRLRTLLVGGLRRWVPELVFREAEDPRLQALRQLSADRRLDYLLHLGPPFHGLVTDTPFATVIWDLQHRRQPCFPEVTSKGLFAYRERVFGEALRRATHVVVGTEAGRREVELFYQVHPDRMVKLPHPTPSFALQPWTRPDPGWLGRWGIRQPYVLYPAQFWPHKNHLGLLRALQIVNSPPDRALMAVFVGSDQGNRTHVQDLVREMGLEHRVRILGFVPQAELVGLYQLALALVYVSYFGPENLPPLEAFALGCPVVASAVDGAEEQLGDAALLAAPADHRTLATQITRLLDEPELRQVLVARGTARAKRWTVDHYCDGLLRMLEDFVPVRSCWP